MSRQCRLLITTLVECVFMHHSSHVLDFSRWRNFIGDLSGRAKTDASNLCHLAIRQFRLLMALDGILMDP